jgi:hypothetical protein
LNPLKCDVKHVPFFGAFADFDVCVDSVRGKVSVAVAALLHLDLARGLLGEFDCSRHLVQPFFANFTSKSSLH